MLVDLWKRGTCLAATCCGVPVAVCRQRRVLLDLGGRTFDSSVLWFLRWYPLEFTEVHVFEVEEFIFQIPPHSTDEDPVSAACATRSCMLHQYCIALDLWCAVMFAEVLLP